jgi:microcystin-dependent protein
MTTQDLTKGIDITGLEDVTGSEMDQLVDVARTAADKGLTLVTTDTALNTPEVPDPNTPDGMAITPTWWTRYLWIRKPFDNTGTLKVYAWNDEATSDATLLKWYNLGTIAEAALAAAVAAQTTADIADTNANTALLNSNNAITDAADAQTDADAANAAVVALAAQVTALTTALATLLPAGRIMATGKEELFSTTVDQGYLVCDGSAVSRITFATLFAAIGVKYGVGDASTTFNVPDFRARSLIGDNNAALPAGSQGARTLRTVGDVGGVETVTLTGRESGIQTHAHEIQSNGSDSGTVGDVFTKANGANVTSGNTQAVASTPAIDAHTNLPPFGTVRWLIKT